MMKSWMFSGSASARPTAVKKVGSIHGLLVVVLSLMPRPVSPNRVGRSQTPGFGGTAQGWLIDQVDPQGGGHHP